MPICSFWNIISRTSELLNESKWIHLYKFMGYSLFLLKSKRINHIKQASKWVMSTSVIQTGGCNMIWEH